MKSSRQKSRKRYTEDERRKLIRWLEERAAKPIQTRLTWHEIERYIGFSKMRLSRDPEVMRAYHSAKAASRAGSTKRRAVPVKNLQLEIKIESLQSEISRYTNERNQWLLLWGRWQYNAHRKGWDVNELEKPLPPARHRKYARSGAK